MDLGGSWAPFGKGLGRSGAFFRSSWALPGHFLTVRNRTFIKHWSKKGSKRPSGLISGGSGKGLGRILGGFGKVLGKISGILEQISGRFGAKSG